MLSKIKTREELKSEICEAHRRVSKIVITNSCFDILHVGHLRYLQEAKQLGDILIVAINDLWCQKMNGLRCWRLWRDCVTIFPELDSVQFLKELHPDIHVKGGDYTIDKVIERETMKSLGGELRLIPEAPGKYTSNLIKLILERYGSCKRT